MRWYRDSVIGKLMLPIVLLMLVGYGLVAVLNGFWLYDVGWEGASEEGREATLRASIALEGYFDKYAAVLGTLAQSEDVRSFASIIAERNPSAYSGNEDYARYLASITRTAQSDKNILNIYFGSERTQTIFDTDEWEASADYRVSERDWYREGKRADSLFFTDPYLDAITGKPVLSITYPIYIGSSLQGLLGMDLLLDTVNDVVSSVATHEGGYAFVMDRKGTILVHPDPRMVFSTNGTQLEGKLGAICKDMVSGKSGLGEAVYQGEPQLVFYNPVELMGWSLGTLVPKKAVTQPVTNRVTISVAVSLIAIICVGFLTFQVAKRSVAPLRQLAGMAEQVAGGDLTVNLAASGSDEIGNMAASFVRMTEGLRDIIGNLRQYSQQVADTSQELSASSEEAGASIEEVAASANEFAGMATEMSSNVQRMADSARHVTDTASAGDQAVSKAVDETTMLQGHMTNLAGKVESLGDRSQEIGRIVEMISDIAAQTNLLALNAAIEAARAGEFGRGFAVVAEEVRKLAEQSSEATAEIGLLIGRIQGETEGTVVGMRESVVQVEHTLGVVKASGERLQEILQETDLVASEIRQISAGTEQMSGGSQEIAAATEEQSAAIQQVASSSQLLSNMAQELQRVVNQFRL